MSTTRVMSGTEAGSARGAVEWEVRLREGELDAREIAAFEAWQRDEANGR
ncbi:DUF4880 domain-containing protein, partial [Paraburkholderia sp. Ac-20347]|nr:DUF4880 domain-containing protein [Paraburkholderia sp. Ac-20347]